MGHPLLFSAICHIVSSLSLWKLSSLYPMQIYNLSFISISPCSVSTYIRYIRIRQKIFCQLHQQVQSLLSYHNIYVFIGHCSFIKAKFWIAYFHEQNNYTDAMNLPACVVIVLNVLGINYPVSLPQCVDTSPFKFSLN